MLSNINPPCPTWSPSPCLSLPAARPAPTPTLQPVPAASAVSMGKDCSVPDRQSLVPGRRKHGDSRASLTSLGPKSLTPSSLCGRRVGKDSGGTLVNPVSNRENTDSSSKAISVVTGEKSPFRVWCQQVRDSRLSAQENCTAELLYHDSSVST